MKHIVSATLLLFGQTAAAKKPSATAGSANNDPWQETHLSDPAYETVVTGYRTHPTDVVTGFAETVEVPQGTAQITVDEVLDEQVGVTIRRSGGPGSFAEIGIRGASAKQVPLLLDDIEVQSGLSGMANLKDFSLALFETIEVYRGNAPILLGASGIGGLVRLKTRFPTVPTTQTTVGLGSFGAKRLALMQAGPTGPLRTILILSADSADGDFTYLNLGGTYHETGDDTWQLRDNNQHTAYDILLKTRYQGTDWQTTAGLTLFSKTAGVPSPDGVTAAPASLSTQRIHTTVVGERSMGIADLRLQAGYQRGLETFFNPGVFVNGASRMVSRTHTADAVLGIESAWHRRHTTTVRLSDRFETTAHREWPSRGRDDTSRFLRNRFEAGLAHFWCPRRIITLSPALRTSIIQSASRNGADPTSEDQLVENHRLQYDISPTLGVRYDATDHIILRSNGGRYVRLPELGELFGYSGAVKGNPHLEMETGINWDVGATLRVDRLGPLTNIKLETALFGSHVDHLIQYVENSQNAVWPENGGRALILGTESTLSVTLFSLVTVQTNHTYLHARDRSDAPSYRGKLLPGRPAHQVNGRIEGDFTYSNLKQSLWFSSDFISKSYLTRYNQSESFIPRRLFVDLGYRIELPAARLQITLEVKNLSDQKSARVPSGRTVPLRDFLGYPLPGRSFCLTLLLKV